jgi:hypothetical protein
MAVSPSSLLSENNRKQATDHPENPFSPSIQTFHHGQFRCCDLKAGEAFFLKNIWSYFGDAFL